MEFNDHVEELELYELGDSLGKVAHSLKMDPKDIIKLDSNENPYGAPKEAVLAINSSMWECSVYPDDSMYSLKTALSKRFDITKDNLVIGTGRDQVIDMALRAKCSPGDKILCAPTVTILYKIYAERVGAEMIHTHSDHHNIDEFLESYDEHKPKMIFLSLPNNLLGDCLDSEDVYKLLDHVDSNTIVILDGAFQEYAAFKDKAKEIEPKDVIEKYQNVIYIGTFSKIYGLGGMRVGYGIASPELSEVLSKFRPPYNIATLSQVAAVASLEAKEYIRNCLHKNSSEMERFIDFAKAWSLPYLESYANFLTLPLNIYSSTRVKNGLLKHGVMVYDLKPYGVNAIRVTIGTESQNDIFLERFETYIKT
ncbi:MAG: histidinol-phosphate transaminase [Campylobacterales bacterium]